jgi:methyl-accepting chemotaxis protein
MASSPDSTNAVGGGTRPLTGQGAGQVDSVAALSVVKAQVASLHQLTDEIVGKCISTSETEVMAAGDAVRAIYDETRDQVTAMDAAVASLGKEASKGSEASLGAAMRRQGEMFADFMNQLSKRLETQSTAAKQALAMVAKVHEFTKKVSNLWSAARILTVNARIEASHLGAQGAGFAVIAQEMGEFTVAVAKANEATSGIAQQIAETIPSIAAASDAMVTSARAFSARLADEAGRLERTYSEAMGTAVTALSTANDAAKKTVERAQEVLSHLQFQDMLSQALRQMEELANTVSTNVDGLAAGRLSRDQVAPLATKSVFDQGEVANNERGDVLLF